MLLGILVLVIGAVFLLQNLGLVAQNAWSIIWPILLIAIGLYMMIQRTKK